MGWKEAQIYRNNFLRELICGKLFPEKLNYVFVSVWKDSGASFSKLSSYVFCFAIIRCFQSLITAAHFFQLKFLPKIMNLAVCFVNELDARMIRYVVNWTFSNPWTVKGLLIYSGGSSKKSFLIQFREVKEAQFSFGTNAILI